MASHTAPRPDFVSLAHLHAALDSVLEIERLLDRATVPLASQHRAERLEALAAEMREILRSLLSRNQA